jgi:glycosyltransferase involved in cell wall biosynthesis
MNKISVVICTRDRHDSIATAIESVSECDYPAFDIHIMDQSTTDQTRQIVLELAQRLATRCPIVYHHLDKAGLSRAYNAGFRATDSQLVACTDDDVTVPRNWLSRIAEAFEKDPELGLLYGQVLVPDALRELVSQGMIVPALTWDKPERLHQKQRNFKVWGMGANMAIRRSLLDQVQGFDEALGGGGPLRSSQDFDFSYRTYRSGMAILLDPSVMVDHYGTRTKDQWPLTMKNYGIGDGAFYGKHIRCGDSLALRLLLRQIGVSVRRSLGSSLRQRRPVLDPYGRYIGQGLRDGARFDIDRKHRLYGQNRGGALEVTEANRVTAFKG